MKKLLVISALGRKGFSSEQLEKLESVACVTFHAELNSFRNSQELINLAAGFDLLGITRRSIKEIDKKIIDLLPSLTGIAVYSTGCEWIDYEYLKQKKVLLSYLPYYSSISVAEHALGMLLTLSRRIHLSYDRTNGRLNEDISLRGFELYGKTVGIIGLGRIGSKIAALLKSFNCNVIYFDKNKTIQNLDAKSTDLDSLCRLSDILILTPSKKRGETALIDKNRIENMKRGVYIINPARSDLVDSESLVYGIKERIISGYAVDDFVPELKEREKEFDFGRILMTGHTAWYSTEAITRGAECWVDNMVALALDRPQNLFSDV